MRRHRHRHRWAIVVAATIAVTAIAFYLQHTDPSSNPNVPHGEPDPGGRRVAFLERAARNAAPGGTDVRIRTHRYAWDLGGCDGGAAGWARVEVDIDFRAVPVPLIDAAMAAQHWRQLPVVGGDAVRNYEPAPRDVYGGYATLAAEGSSWELEFSADPAHVPTHDC